MPDPRQNQTSVIRPVLPPGTRLLRRDPDHLVIGSGPGTVVPIRPGLLEALRLADGIRSADRIDQIVRLGLPEADLGREDLLAPLLAQGVLLPRLPPKPLLPSVCVQHDEAASPFVAMLTPEFRLVEDPHEAQLVLVATNGEPARETFRDLTARQLPHLVVVLDESRVHLGPLVIPGRTPCLECYDRQHAQVVPHWSVLVPQFGRQPLACAVPRSTQLRAAAIVLESINSVSRPRFVANRTTVESDGEQHDETFGFWSGCSCSLLPAG